MRHPHERAWSASHHSHGVSHGAASAHLGQNGLEQALHAQGRQVFLRLAQVGFDVRVVCDGLAEGVSKVVADIVGFLRPRLFRRTLPGPRHGHRRRGVVLHKEVSAGCTERIPDVARMRGRKALECIAYFSWISFSAPALRTMPAVESGPCTRWRRASEASDARGQRWGGAGVTVGRFAVRAPGCLSAPLVDLFDEAWGGSARAARPETDTARP